MVETKEEIAQALSDRVDAVMDWMTAQGDVCFMFAPEGRWTTGQHLAHLVTTIEPLNQALSLPRMVLRMRFGTTKRDGWSYDQVIENYQAALEKGGASGKYAPDAIQLDEKQELLNQYQAEKNKLIATIPKWSDVDLDKFVVPHPLIGNMSLREILFFTIYHIQRHLDNLQKDYA